MYDNRCEHPTVGDGHIDQVLVVLLLFSQPLWRQATTVAGQVLHPKGVDHRFAEICGDEPFDQAR